AVEADAMRRHRPIEVQRLHARPRKRGVNSRQTHQYQTRRFMFPLFVSRAFARVAHRSEQGARHTVARAMYARNTECFRASPSTFLRVNYCEINNVEEIAGAHRAKDRQGCGCEGAAPATLLEPTLLSMRAPVI